MRSHAGVASTVFRALAEQGIEPRMVATSEIKVSVVVDEKQLEAGVRALHGAFGLAAAPREDFLNRGAAG
jgi:aspartate kinase